MNRRDATRPQAVFEEFGPVGHYVAIYVDVQGIAPERPAAKAVFVLEVPAAGIRIPWIEGKSAEESVAIWKQEKGF